MRKRITQTFDEYFSVENIYIHLFQKMSFIQKKLKLKCLIRNYLNYLFYA